MKFLRITGFTDLAHCLVWMKEIAPSDAISQDTRNQMIIAFDNLRDVVESKLMPVQHCVRSGRTLLHYLEKFKQEGKVEPSDCMLFKLTLETFETNLREELLGAPTFFVSRKRAYDTMILLNAAEEMLSESSKAQLTEHLHSNWREAGRCLAVGAPTAATFHMLRVVEGVVRRYFKQVTGMKAPPAGKVGLGAYIKGLKGKALGDVVTALNQLRASHRNPTMHPGPTVTIDKAVSLFGLCVSVIDEIALDTERRQRAIAVATSATTP